MTCATARRRAHLGRPLGDVRTAAPGPRVDQDDLGPVRAPAARDGRRGHEHDRRDARRRADHARLPARSGARPGRQAARHRGGGRRCNRAVVLFPGGHQEAFWRDGFARLVADVWKLERREEPRIEPRSAELWAARHGGLDGVHPAMPARAKIWRLGPVFYGADGEQQAGAPDAHELRAEWAWEWEADFTAESAHWHAMHRAPSCTRRCRKPRSPGRSAGERAERRGGSVRTEDRQLEQVCCQSAASSSRAPDRSPSSTFPRPASSPPLIGLDDDEPDESAGIGTIASSDLPRSERRRRTCVLCWVAVLVIHEVVPAP